MTAPSVPNLVCPAGSLRALQGAVDAGADAVYMGLKDATNARNFAGLNFNLEQAREGVLYAHERGRQVLMALNTFADARSLNPWYRAVDSAVAMGVDALIAPGYYATMGYGVPAGLGLQAATGRCPLVLVGDGAFQMTGWELGNAQRYGWDPIVLVFNNAGWEMLRAFEPAARFNDLSRWDFAAMAAGMGGDGHLVRTRAELKSALQHAQATRGRFQLLDIRLARGARSPTLERFVNAVKRLSSPTPPPTRPPTEARRP